VYVNQDLLLSEFNVGINGRQQKPFEFVGFKTAASETDGVQLKFDTWLFHFMNVFELLGRIDGDALVGLALDGNAKFEHLGIAVRLRNRFARCFRIRLSSCRRSLHSIEEQPTASAPYSQRAGTTGS
jgi:hypothetical protein